MFFWWICRGESVLPVLFLRHLSSSLWPADSLPPGKPLYQQPNPNHFPVHLRYFSSVLYIILFTELSADISKKYAKQSLVFYPYILLLSLLCGPFAHSMFPGSALLLQPTSQAVPCNFCLLISEDFTLHPCSHCSSDCHSHKSTFPMGISPDSPRVIPKHVWNWQPSHPTALLLLFFISSSLWTVPLSS